MTAFSMTISMTVLAITGVFGGSEGQEALHQKTKGS